MPQIPNSSVASFVRLSNVICFCLLLILLSCIKHDLRNLRATIHCITVMVISISSPFLAAHIFCQTLLQYLCNMYHSSITFLSSLLSLFLLHDNSYSDTLYSLFSGNVLASFSNFIRIFNLSVYLRVIFNNS